MSNDYQVFVLKNGEKVQVPNNPDALIEFMKTNQGNLRTYKITGVEINPDDFDIKPDN